MSPPEDRLWQMVHQAMQSAQPKQGAAPETAEYPWDAPSRFTPAQWQDVARLSQSIGEGLARCLTAQLQTEIALEALPPAQCYARNLGGAEDVLLQYAAPLAAESGQPCGLISLPTAQAVHWVASLLGGASAAGADRALSGLETELLLELFSAAGEALAWTSPGGAKRRLKVLPEVRRAPQALGRDPLEEYCRLEYRQPSQAQACLCLCIASDPVEGLLDQDSRTPSRQDAEECRKRMLGHLRRATVRVSASLGGQATMRDIALLEPGDVLMLEPSPRDAVQLTVDGRPTLRGRPCRCNGFHAIQIVDISSPRPPQPRAGGAARQE